MKKYLLLLIIIIPLTLYFFIFKTQSNNTQINNYKDKEKLKTENTIIKDNSKNKIENKKVDLIENFVNTKIVLPKNYDEKISYDKPNSDSKKSALKDNSVKIDVNIDINKETKEFEKLKFKLEKNF